MSIQKILLQFEPKSENLLPVLKEIQKHFGYISKEESEKIAVYFALPEARVFSVASFHDLLKTKKPIKKTIKVCSGGVCVSRRSMEIVQRIGRFLKIELGNDAHPACKLELMSCAGLCDRGPLVEIEGKMFEKVRLEMVEEILKNNL